MNVADVIAYLKSAGVSLRLEHGRLLGRAAKGTLTDELKVLIQTRKQELIEYLGGLSALETTPSIEPVARDSKVPLSHAQEGLFFLDKLGHGSANYNMVAALRLEGALDRELMARALEELACRQEALRLRIVQSGDSALQTTDTDARPDLTFSDGGEADVLPLVQRESERPFDLARDRLFRATLLRLSERAHVLVLCMHHLIGDGWSLGILAQEISVIYTALEEGRSWSLPALSLQYLDFVAWHRQQFEKGLLAEQLGYWKRTLEGAPAVLNVGTDHPRPARRSDSGASLHMELPNELLERIQSDAHSEGVTLFMYLFAAFSVLVSRYSGQRDLVIGTPVANRRYVELEQVVGFFVNTLALRSRVSPDMTFRQLLRATKGTTLEALRHSDVSFPQIVEQLSPERSLSYSPIFQINFGLQNAPTSELTLGGLRIVPIEFQSSLTKFDLSLNAAVEDGGLLVNAEYSTDLYERATVASILDDYRSLLEVLVGRADRKLSELSIASLERRTLELAHGRSAAREGTGVLALLARVAARQAEAVAASLGGESIRYGELESRSGQLAGLLQQRGLGAEAMIGLMAEPSPEFLVAVLAIMKAGCTYLPLDPSYPQPRLEAMLRDSSVRLVLTDRRYADSDLLASRNRMSIPEAEREAARQKLNAPQLAEQPARAAYVIYTSGSTGAPKGVVVTFGGLNNLVAHLLEALRLRPSDRVLQFTPSSFDVSMQELFTALAAGAHIVFPPRAQPRLGPQLAQLLRAERITVATLPPSVLHSTEPEDLPCLRLVVTGAEAISEALVARWGKGREFYYNYGPTEASVTTTAKFCTAQDGRPSIGRPLDNCSVYLTDPRMALVPKGVAGEVLIGGAGVARGYLGDPVLTAEKFLPDPYSGVPGARVYRSGDLARWNRQRDLEFVGRLDTQVKVRGFRIELGEIEAALVQHPQVLDAVVVVRGEAPDDRRILAYVLHAHEAEPAALKGALRDHLKACLPHYMLPSSIMALSQFPIGPNGKVDVPALPEPFLEGASELASEEGADWAATIAAIFASVIGVAEVAPEESFFDVGGDSLLAVKAVSRIQESLAIEINVSDIFDEPTAQGLAARLAPQGQSADDVQKLIRQLEALSEEEALRLASELQVSPQ